MGYRGNSEYYFGTVERAWHASRGFVCETTKKDDEMKAAAVVIFLLLCPRGIVMIYAGEILEC